MAGADVRLFASTTPTSRPPAPAGTLLPPAAAPRVGERFECLLDLGNVAVEQILSGENDQPAAYSQDHDEWVVVLAGAAVLDVDGERRDLGPGDWAFLPAGVAHTVVRTSAGTSWLAVHVGPPA